jgi:cytoskeleton protein RodZ
MSSETEFPGKQLSIEGVETVHGWMAISRAREARGMSLDELSNKLKVSVRKLEHIEHGDFDQIAGGDAHVRGLVRAMCKAVGIDAEPVLHYMPESIEGNPLSRIDTRMVAPFAASGRMGKLSTGTPMRRTAYSERSNSLPRLSRMSNGWIAGAMLAAMAALLLYAWPVLQPQFERLWQLAAKSVPVMPANISAADTKSGAKPAANAAPAGANSVNTSETTAAKASANAIDASNVSIAPAEPMAPAVNASATVLATGPDPEKLTIEASSPTWIEIRNAKGLLLVSRNLFAGERLDQGLENKRSVVVGNASGAKVWLRGKILDVQAQARDNVARFDVQ